MKKMRKFNDENFIRAIVEAANEKKLVLFIGAGFSKLCGLPLWLELADKLIDKCVEYPKLKFDHESKEQTKKDKDSRTLITIAYQLFEDYGDINDFKKELTNSLDIKKIKFSKKDKETTERLLKIIKKLNATIITTNSDELLHELFEKSYIHFNADDIADFKLTTERHLLQIHGFIDDDNSLVYTVKQYLDLYRKPGFKTSIKNIFNSDHTILFIGYSLSEMQFLDFLADENKNKGNKRYILEGLFDNEYHSYRALESYYKSFDIEVISYSKNNENYYGLVTALETIAEEIDKKSSSMSSNISGASSLIMGEASSEKLASLNNFFKGIERDEEKNYIFEKITESKYALDWLEVVKNNDQENFFNISKNLKTSEIEDGKYKAVDFLALTVIRNVYVKTNDENIIITFIHFILEIFNKFKQDVRLYSNYRVINILLNMIFLSKILMEKSETTEFVSSLKEKEIFNSDWLSWILYEDNNKLMSLSEDYLFKYIHLILSYYNNDSLNYYSLESFVKGYSYEISIKYPNKITQVIFEEFSKNIDENSVYAINDFGSIIKASRSNAFINNSNYNKIILYWFLVCLKYIDDNEMKKYYDKIQNNQNRINSKILIYLIYLKPNLFKENIFNLKENVFNDWNKFSDLYVLLKEKPIIIKNKEKELVLLIENMQLGGHSEFRNNTSKYDLFKLLETYGISAANEKANLFFSKLDETKIEQYKNLPKPEFRNSSYRVDIHQNAPDKAFFDYLEGLSLDEFFKIINQNYVFEKEMAVSDVFAIKFKNEEIISWLSNNEFENIVKIPKKDYKRAIYLLTSNHLKNNFDSTMNIIKQIINKQEAHKVIETYRTILHEIKFGILKDKKSDEILLNKVFAEVINIYENKLYEVTEDPKNEKFSFSTLFNMDLYIIFSIIVKIANILRPKIIEVMTIIKDEYSKNNHRYINAIIAALIKEIWNIDSEWFSENIEIIFEEYEGINYGFIGYELSFYIDHDITELLYEKNILKKMLDSFDDNHNKLVLIHNLLSIKNKTRYSTEIEELVIKSKNNVYGIAHYLEKYYEITDSNLLNENMKSLLISLNKFDIGEPKHSGRLILILLNYYIKFENKAIIWSAVMKLSKNKTSSHVTRIIDKVTSIGIGNNQLMDFAVDYSLGIADKYSNKPHIQKLVLYVDWKDDIERYHILRNKLGKINPGFFDVLPENPVKDK